MSFTVVRSLVDRARDVLCRGPHRALLAAVVAGGLCVSALASGCGSPDPGLPHLPFIGDMGPDGSVGNDLVPGPDSSSPDGSNPGPDMSHPGPDMVMQQQFPMYAHDKATLFLIQVPSFDLTVIGDFNANDDM